MKLIADVQEHSLTYRPDHYNTNDEHTKSVKNTLNCIKHKMKQDNLKLQS